MSLTVKHLNADATFLLTFTPSFAPQDSKHKFPGSFTILVDPWLDGDSVIYHPKFANSRHRTPPAIKTLAELEDEIDLIIISQEKADHLSRRTLCSLPRNSKTRILATANAARKIRGWKYFHDTSIVQVMEPFQARTKDNVIRIPVEPYSSASSDGEVTIANISQKRDITGLHNAIGITYCPPGTVLTSCDGSARRLESMPVMGMSASHELPSPDLPTRSKHEDIGGGGDVRGRTQERDFVVTPRFLTQPEGEDGPLLRPFAPLLHGDSTVTRPSTSGSRAPGVSTVAKRPDNHEDVISVIFTPHGLDPAAMRPYIDHHLRQLKHAFPVTALFHSFNEEANPWWLGGKVLQGAPGGVKIAHDARVKYWISAHDGEKDLRGFATKLTRSRKYAVREVVEMLQNSDGHHGEKGATEVCRVECGQTRRFV